MALATVSRNSPKRQNQRHRDWPATRGREPQRRDKRSPRPSASVGRRAWPPKRITKLSESRPSVRGLSFARCRRWPILWLNHCLPATSSADKSGRWRYVTANSTREMWNTFLVASPTMANLLDGRDHQITTSSPLYRQWILQMKDDLVKNEMRLAAIEYLLCQLWVNSMKFGGVTEQEFAWRTDAMVANLKKQTFPGLDHLAAGQLEEAVGHLVDIQREMLGFQKVQKV
jgi:hypothetical protein